MEHGRATILVAVAVFAGLPVIFYMIDDVPRRTLLKEAIPIATLLAFAMMTSQFFMARSNTWLLSIFKSLQIGWSTNTSPIRRWL